MKKKLSFATTITTTILFLILSSVEIPFLFFSAFILLLAKGILMYVAAISEHYKVNEEQPVSNFSKLLTVRIVWQLTAIGMIACTLFVFFLKKDVWKQFL